MKTAKRISVVILSILIIAIIPLNAFAAKIVNTLDLTVNVEPGIMLFNHKEYITINTPGVDISDEFYVYEIYEGESYSPFSDCFEPGCTYELIIILNTTDGYDFAERESLFKSVTVNGEDVYFESYESEGNDCYAVFATVEIDNKISEIDITVEPAVGYLIDDYYRYVKINSIGVEFEEKLDNGVNVTDYYGGNPFNYFVEEEYIIEICLTPARNCEFTKDDDGNIQFDNVKVNGEDVEYTTHIENDRGYIEYIIIKLTVTPAEKAVINVIELTIEEDLKGYNVEDYNEYITIETQGVNFDTYDMYAVCAYNSDYEDVYTFEGGDYYWLVMNFITEDGYIFDPDGVVITINGVEYNYVSYYVYETEDGVTVEFVSTPYETDYAGNFFDRVIFWFKHSFETIINFFFGWMYI